MILGDINGDGVLEMVMLRSDSGIDNRYIPHQVTCVTALDIKGNVLWTVGEPTDAAGGTGSDYPAQIYDYDGDGNLEVLVVMDRMFKVLDGRTGALKIEYPLPHDHAHDCIILANLSGADKPKNVILKDRYRTMWAMSHDFKVIWTFKGNPGHFPYPYDFNGDGFDEIMAGYDMLDHKGNLMWSVNQNGGHADCIFVADLFNDPKRGVQYVIGGETTGIYDTDGKELARYDGAVETQHVAVGKFRTDIQGLQIACLDRIIRDGPKEGRRDGMFLLDNNGGLILKENRQTPGWMTIIETIQGWDGSSLDYILAYRRGGVIEPTIYDGHFNPVAVFPVGADEETYVEHASIFGDGRVELIFYNNREINIFSSVERDLDKIGNGKRLPQPKRLYMHTTYPGAENVPLNI
jgi:hypothetical protein